MIRLYGCASPNVYKVSILLEELGLAYDLHRINIFAGDQLDPEFVKLSPNNKVPVLLDDDGPHAKPVAVSESGAILLYLAEKSGKFLPSAGIARVRAYQWLMIQMASVGPMFGQFGHFTRYAPPGNDYAITRFRSELGRLISVLDHRVGEAPFLAGDEYSIADIATFPWVRTAVNLYRVSLDEHGALQSWFDRIESRPAVQRGVSEIESRWAEPGLKALETASRDALDRVFGLGNYDHRIAHVER